MSVTASRVAPSTSILASDDTRLVRSRDFCEQLTRRAARNFYYGLKLLPETKRRAMFALYAYMRLVDDIADENDGRSIQQRVADLNKWRGQTHAALNGELPEDDASHGQLWPAISEMARERHLPAYLLDDVIAGQQQDLEFAGFDSFEPLKEYCYRVAGVVGLASIHVWGFDGSPSTEQLAIDRGIAFQLTNILRDLREDAGKGRTYIPTDELASAGVTKDDLRHARGGDSFLKMMRFQIERAESYYDRSAALTDRIAPDSRPTLIAMTEIYRGLLDKIAAEPERVLHERVSLSLFRKLRIGWRATRSRTAS